MCVNSLWVHCATSNNLHINFKSIIIQNVNSCSLKGFKKGQLSGCASPVSVILKYCIYQPVLYSTYQQ